MGDDGNNVPAAPDIRIGRDICGSFELATTREWLVTNGIGGFAAGTVSDACSRRYHGLLIAARSPPLGRRLFVARLEGEARYLGHDYPLSSNEYLDGTIHPHGYRQLVSFAITAGIPTWSFALADARLTRRIWMEQGANTTFVSYQLDEGSAPLALRLVPLCTDRDYHGHWRGGGVPTVEPVLSGVGVRAFGGGTGYRLLCAEGTFRPGTRWFWNFRHRFESERGLDDAEDLFSPGEFSIVLKPGDSATVVCTAEPDEPSAAGVAFVRDQARRRALLRNLAREPAWVRQLALAADQFIVERTAANVDGATVIAGYPWFGDWGRDTMIALPGLTLATGRPELAAKVLRTWAAHVSEGMLPNRFPDAGEVPEYNSVDATLWFFHAIDAYLRATGDDQFAAEIFPRLVDIVDWHVRGTRHGIGVDPADGLLRAGETGFQLTWMDAKVGDRVITPRMGKPVEVNALWHHALRVLAELAARLGEGAAAACYQALAERAGDSFRRRFWCAERGYLYDVVDGPDGEPDSKGNRSDPSLRPNQLFAVALRPTLLGAVEARAVVEVCGRELLTPVGLRSLAPGDPRYLGTCVGGPAARDGAYHQGTVWSWLLGPFALAHYRVHGDRARARAWLRGIVSHLAEGCVGSVSEIFDGDPPHRPRGCFAQAWGVAETLRAWREIGEG